MHKDDTLNLAMEPDRVYDLEERLIGFSLLILKIVDSLPNNRTDNHLAGQLLRSGTSPSFNYGEAQASESRADFIHKMKVCHKELKETRVGLKIIDRRSMTSEPGDVKSALQECEQLVRIFSKSIETAHSNSGN